MKHLVLLSVLAGAQLHAQLPDGSMAPDFTVQAYQPTLGAAGMNGDGSYSLYDYLDAGYTVYAEFTSTLCVPCWNFHQEGVLEDLYAHHGPLLPGHPGVDPGSTDDVMVVWIDAQAGTPDSWLVSGGPFVNGNWIDPNGTGEVPYPMCNPEAAEANQLMDDFMIPFYPTVYRICPNRTVETVWSYDPEVLYAASASCPQPSGAQNAALLRWNESGACPSVECAVTLQNMGTGELTGAQIVFRKGAELIQTVSWSGSLATYQTADVYLTTIDPQLDETYTAEIVTPDDNASDNTLVRDIGPVPVAAGFTVTVEIATDAFGNETRWELIGLSTGEAVAMGGPYSLVQPPATVPQPPVQATLQEQECYIFRIFDPDGMVNGAGNGSYAVRDEAGNVLVQGGAFAGSEQKRFIVNGSAGVSEEGAAPLKVYPNPASELVNVAFDGDGSDYAIVAADICGRELHTARIAHASGAQVVGIPTGAWTAGTYLITVRGGGSVRRMQVVVE